MKELVVLLKLPCSPANTLCCAYPHPVRDNVWTSCWKRSRSLWWCACCSSVVWVGCVAVTGMPSWRCSPLVCSFCALPKGCTEALRGCCCQHCFIIELYTGKKFLRLQWPVEKSISVIYLQNDIKVQFNQTLIGVFMGHSVTAARLDGGCVGARAGTDWGWTFLWQESSADQMCEDEGITNDSNHVGGKSLCCDGLPGSCPADWMPAQLNYLSWI